MQHQKPPARLRGMSFWRLRLVTLFLAAMTAPGLASGGETAEVAPSPMQQRGPIDETMRGDAALADITFVDRLNGWAVGDRGVIWRTADGGKTWQEQVSNVTCRLESVSFLDAQHGWIVGGARAPFDRGSRGVVLRTVDGGTTWLVMPKLRLPMLARVKFFNSNQGIAVGASSPSAPSGVFATQDGGRTWLAVTADESGEWLTGDFIDERTGAVGGTGGRVGTLVERRVGMSPLAGGLLRSLRGMQLVAPTGGWAVGDGGLVMTTSDLGHSWQLPIGELPPRTSDYFDFRTVAVVGERVWVAGVPGTRVFHSADGGATWESFATGQRAPISAIRFIDDNHGWAAGELGTILATEDGGRTWRTQRRGGERAALLGLFARGGDVPLEWIAEQGAEEGYLTAIDLLFAPAHDGSDRVNRDRMAKSHEAMILTGATSAATSWRFPIDDDDLALPAPDIIAVLNRRSDGRAIERIENHLVRAIRMWRPDVVVTDQGAEQHADGRSALVQQLVRRAIEAAGDANQHAALANAAGLDSWTVKKVYGLLPPNKRGDEVVNTARFAPRLGDMLLDWSAPARQIAPGDFGPVPDVYGFVLLTDRTDGTDGPRGMFRGISLEFGGEARRPTANLPVDNLEELRRQATRRKHLRELIEHSEASAAWAGQVSQLLEGLDGKSAGDLLFQLGEGYREAGRIDLAADTYYLLARRCPDHGATTRALAWLVQFYASAETGQRLAGERPQNRRNAKSPRSSARVPEATGNVEQASLERTVGGDAAPVIGIGRDERLRRAVQLGEYLEAARPDLFADPTIRFPLVAAQRGLGYANPAKRYFLTLAKLPENDPWRRCAETEQWFGDPSGLPPTKVLGSCRRTPHRPHLDGALNEAFWESSERLRLKGTGFAGSSESNATVRLAYDDEFLYIAIECAKLPSAVYEAGDGPRPRDAELTAHDRVTLRVDVDRDYTTAYELTIDSRGWTHEACWGDASWNPTWYVAQSADAATWRIEAAIAHAQLVSEPPSPRQVWAAAIERAVPRAGTATWAGAGAEDGSPDRFGLVIFE